MLTRIVADIRQDVAIKKVAKPMDSLDMNPGSFALSRALKSTDWSLIAECKLASPAKGLLCTTHSVPELAQTFTTNGAAALSVHTSTPFHGKIGDIAAVRKVSHLPILRKDFIIDEYQIHESRSAGADAILLIAAILSDAELKDFLAIAHELGLDCLVEVHGLRELNRVQKTDAQLVGINNRDLTTFTTDINQTFQLLPHCDPLRLIISESGINNREDAQRLKSAGVRGALVGEGLVKAPDIATQTRQLSRPDNELEG